MLTAKQRREYQEIAKALKQNKVTITGRTIKVGKTALDLPQLPVKTSVTQGIF